MFLSMAPAFVQAIRGSARTDDPSRLIYLGYSVIVIDTGMFVGVGTASGSWRRMGTAGGVGNQY